MDIFMFEHLNIFFFTSILEPYQKKVVILCNFSDRIKPKKKKKKKKKTQSDKNTLCLSIKKNTQNLQFPYFQAWFSLGKTTYGSLSHQIFYAWDISGDKLIPCEFGRFHDTCSTKDKSIEIACFVCF